VEGVAHVSRKSSFALVDGEVEAPGFPNDLEAELVELLFEEHVQTALLVLQRPIHLLGVVTLRLDRHVHFDQAIVTAGRVLIVVYLVFGHIATSHTGVLIDEPFLELPV
jgi:hypothetical protein